MKATIIKMTPKHQILYKSHVKIITLRRYDIRQISLKLKLSTCQDHWYRDTGSHDDRPLEHPGRHHNVKISS